MKTELGVGDAPTQLDSIEPAEPPESTGEPVRGDNLGRFVVLDVLGVGGMGVVYSAYDPELDRKVAIKLLRAAVRAGSSDAGTRLLREAQAMAKINHPDVITVHDVGTHRDQVYVAMEFADGGTLRAWLQNADRAVDDIVRIFIHAGRGLAAAHAAGLVHRDFKPDNVMLTSDGGVRVTDFGLVGLATADDSIPDTIRDAPASSRALTTGRNTPLSEDLTRTGAVMGTPTYMAPEQFSGATATERSDQFSFCVALYEALYKVRPFAGVSFVELSSRVLLGDVTPPPAGVRVPSWLRRVVMRGLAVEPSDRFPSMTALLAALAGDPRRRRNHILAIAGAGIALVVAVVTTVAITRRDGDAGAACPTGDDRIARVWGPAQRARIASAFAASARPQATATVDKLAPLLDAWSRRWSDGFVDACEATRVRGEQSDHLLDLRMQCLTRRLDDASATIELLAAGGNDAVDRALDAARALPAIDACADPASLLATVEPPADDVMRVRVAAVRGRLTEIRAEDRLGRYPVALANARAALVDARAIGYPPIAAEASLVLGQAEANAGTNEEIAQLHDALYTATEAGDDAVMVEAARALVVAMASRGGHFEAAREIVQLAEATTRRLHLTSEVVLWLAATHAMLDSHQGHNAEARKRLEDALSLAEKHLGPDDPIVFAILDNLGSIANAEGHFDEAAKLHERVLAITERVYGGDHPHVAAALNDLGIAYRNGGRLADAKRAFERELAIMRAAEGDAASDVGMAYDSLATVYIEQGEPATAQIYIEKALAIWEKIYGDHGVALAPALGNLGTALSDQGKLDEARVVYERALALQELAFGPDDPRVGATSSNLGTIAQAQKRYADALALYTRALRIAEKAYGPNHPDVADYLLNLATVYKSLGRMDEAMATHVRTLDVIAKAYGPDHPRMAMALVNYGSMQQSRHDYAGALASFQRGLEIFEAKLKPDHPYASYALLGIGEALIALRRQPEAVPFLERAVAIRVAAKMPADQIAEVTDALARAKR